MIVQVEFPIQGTTIPVDHGYFLSGAIKSSGVLSQDDFRNTIVAPIIGKRTPDPEKISIRNSRLKFRCPEVVAKKLIRLTGKTLRIGRSTITVKAPEFWGLAPVEELRSKIVIFKNSLSVDEIETKVRESIERTGCDPNIVEIEVGRRKAIRVKGKHQCGRFVALRNLPPKTSLSIMETGMGARTSFGAGWFEPI